MKNKILFGEITIIGLLIILAVVLYVRNDHKVSNISVNLTELTYTIKDKNQIKVYTQDNFDNFKKDYEDKKLPSIYITEFLFDGVGMYKPYDLDDFIDNGNNLEIDPLEITTLNINTGGNIVLSGELTKGMIAINTNDLKDDINIVLNGVKIDTDSKKIPAIYVYNKDINYTKHKVTIEIENNTKNYVTGGKLKKVSLIGSDELSSYTTKYNNENMTNYETYSNYYGIYTNAEIAKVLFAKIEADSENLRDGDPYYFYKAAGAISSDIDLYFTGAGYLEVTSNKNEGIESKGNLSLGNGLGDYVIYAFDDCLNTTTASKDAHNALTIDVKSLTAIVLEEADEGDAIDSNGDLTINGGTIIAIAHPGQDFGIDSDNTIINGGTVIATGDMYDKINSNQNYLTLAFNEEMQNAELLTVLDENEKVILSYKTDRTYKYLLFSSASLTNGTYTIYKDGIITGTENKGLYTNVTGYEKGIQLGYATKGEINEMMGGNNRAFTPDDRENQNANEGRMTPPDASGNPPEMPNENVILSDDNNSNGRKPDDKLEDNNIVEITNKEFIIDNISNIFNGVGKITS